MSNKQKCEELRKIRVSLAKKLGIQGKIRQTPCDYKGECKGTCPACEKEERLLNKEMLGRIGLVAGMSTCLIACGTGALAGDVVEAEPKYNVSSEELGDDELCGDVLEGEIESYYDEEDEENEYEGL
ncbi:MAG: hypothetical protein J6A59_09195 [Lachnospiraceae bacterium]|nr:hypothetical protein [Lachnospiraceae bacterium]